MLMVKYYLIITTMHLKYFIGSIFLNYRTFDVLHVTMCIKKAKFYIFISYLIQLVFYNLYRPTTDQGTLEAMEVGYPTDKLSSQLLGYYEI